MQTNLLTPAEPMQVMPSRQALERLRVYSIIQFKQRQAERKLRAAKAALSFANKLKNPEQKKYHRSRIFSALNKLRAMV